MATLDFERLSKDNISPNSVLNFVKNNDSNFNYNELESYYKQQGLKDDALTNALYTDLKNTKGLQISIKPKTPTNDAPLNLQSMPINEFELKKERVLNTLENKSKELKEQGFFERLAEKTANTLEGVLLKKPQFESYKENANKLQELKTLAKENDIDFKDLPKQMQESLKQERNDDGLLSGAINAIQESVTNNATEKAYNDEKNLYQIAKNNKPFESLSDKEQELVKRDLGFFDNFNEKNYNEWKENTRAKDITKEFQKQKAFLDNIHEAKSIANLLNTASETEKQDYLKSLNTLARLQGFDNATTNEKGDVFVSKDNKSYKVNDGFFNNFLDSLKANAFSISGGIIGSVEGAKNAIKKGKINPLSVAIGAGVGGAIGSGLGGITDAVITNHYLNREQNLKETLKHGIQEGLLSLAGDVAIGAAAKLAKPAIKAPLKLASMSMPYQFTRNFFTGNAKRASEIIENTLSKEQQESLKEFADSFGGNVKPNQEGSDFLREKIAKAFNNDSNKLKAYDTLKDIIILDNNKEQQQAFLRAIRADDTGNTIAFLSEAANISPRANNNLKNILRQTSENLRNSLKEYDLKDYEVKSVFDKLEAGTKDSYNQALDGVITKLYDNSYKTNLNDNLSNITAFESFKNDLKAQGKIDPSAKSFLNQVERNIYNKNGVTYEQLRNARQMVNAYERNVKDPSTLGYIQKASAKFLKNDIDNGIDNILKQNKSAYEKIKELHHTAINDYRNMKATMDLIDTAKIRDRNIKEQDAIKSLMKVIQGQGEKDLSNYEVLTKGLNTQDRERLELSMLNRIMQDSTQGDLKVFDSHNFFNKLNEFKGGVFNTPKAKEYIDIANGFHKLFKNDSEIANNLKAATTKNINQGLATTLSGAAKFLWTKFALGTLYRNAPDRFLGLKLPKALNESTAGAALKYHIKRALERSTSVDEFSKNLELSAKNSKFSNDTLKIIDELQGGLNQAKQDFKQASEPATQERLKEATQEPLKAPTNDAHLPQATQEAPLNTKEPATQEPAKEITDKATREWGTNYGEFKGNGLGAIEKLLETKEGYVTGAFHKEGLGDIDLVYGNSKYGLEHILQRREQQALNNGLSEQEAKTYALEIVKKIPEVIEKGKVLKDDLNRLSVVYENQRVGLKDNWQGEKLANKWIVTSYELENSGSLYTSPLITKSEIQPLNSNGANPTQKELIKQEKALTPLQLAEQEKLQKQALEKEKALQDYESYKEDALKREEALKQKLAFERGNAGNLESETKIEVGQDIPLKKLDLAKSRVRLNDGEIFDLDYAIVKAKDLKPSFTTGGTQKRTHMNEEQIKNIAENFDPQKIFGSGGFEDLPIILQDGQVISGNHRIQGMLNFTNKSRAAYDKAIQDYYNITLKPDELLIRVPHKNLNNTEVNNLAAGSNAGRFNSESDKALSVLSHYTPKLKELDKKLNADTIHSLKRLVARDLNFDKATSPNVSDSNLALLMYNMPRSETQGIELLNKWHKEFKDDPKSYEKVKKMFIDNAGSFHNLIHDLNFPKLSLNAYLSDTLDRAFKSIKDYESTTESLKALADKHSASSLGFTEYEKSQHKSDISEILGAALARFARLDDPSNALFEALRSDNIKKGLREHNIADDTKDLLGSDRKVFNDIDIYDFTHYLLKHDRKPNENNQALNQLTRNIKGLQKDYYKSLEKQATNDANLPQATKEAHLNTQEPAREVTEQATNDAPLNAQEPAREITEQATSPYEVIKDKENFLNGLDKNLKEYAVRIPKELNEQEFLKSFNNAINKENFLKHLGTRTDGNVRLANLHLIEPTLKEPLIVTYETINGALRKHYFKPFIKENSKTMNFMVVTQDKDNKFITGTIIRDGSIKNKIKKSAVIHSFMRTEQAKHD
ncbi:putative barnase/colicin E5 family endoribonuclease [Helicobacter cetorum]|uniref:DdrB-like domain-containing protein n=1 Tax=Helicobacter cetorum (strain ATCC BAA-540 / CCUG 52418 / MIT 99-5656) TaxID=1163745 RepID=I0EQK7_HELCM|nr:DUF3519 domain-containing protein [Helicobacter cetorum]AFI05226.1 hypothetical protein HCD_00970 [Helicobacter cetorum MIT 99-5656]